MKNILLIGGSYGIGWDIAQIMSNHATIYIASRSYPNQSNPNIQHITFDAQTGEIPLEALPPSIDGFVYLPGSINLKPFRTLKPEHFKDDMEINFFSMVKVLQTVLPKLQAAEMPSVVLFSSVAATTGMPFHTSIAAAKGAIEGFAKALAGEMAPKMRVNVVAQSLTDTPLAEKFLNNDVKREKAAEKHPLKRVGNSKDIAEAACFLLSDKSSWITGQVLHVDGGLSTLSI
jgi:NAD(P)-dependent dehydrogenase (short-subunit alcohol dehydrogenase family)